RSTELELGAAGIEPAREAEFGKSGVRGRRLQAGKLREVELPRSGELPAAGLVAVGERLQAKPRGSLSETRLKDHQPLEFAAHVPIAQRVSRALCDKRDLLVGHPLCGNNLRYQRPGTLCGHRTK